MRILEGRFVDAELMAEVADRGTALGWPDVIDDLLMREFRPLHRSTPFVEDRRSRHSSLVLTGRRFQGRHQRELQFLKERLPQGFASTTGL